MSNKGLNGRIAEIERMYAEGRSQREIARICGVHQTAISQLMRRHGMQTRPAHPAPGSMAGSANPNWNGDSASYGGFHDRVERHRGRPAHCERCGLNDPGQRYEWACLDEDYTDPWNFARMCTRCHRRYDLARRMAGALSAAEACKRLGVTRDRLFRFIRRGLLEAQKTGAAKNSAYRITEEAVADYLQRRAS